MFADPAWASRFPPLLSFDQVADLLQIPKQTAYDWSSRGLFDECKVKAGKYRRFLRDRLMQKICNGGFDESPRKGC